jgi:nitrogenase-stabilizing/protective protein
MQETEYNVKDFYDLTDAEDYFEFFNLDYDEQLIHVKRFHILKEYGSLIKTAFEQWSDNEEQLLNFLKFSLIRVYGEYKAGKSPSAAEVWNMYKDGKLSGCLSCTPTPGNSCGC